MKSDEAAAPCDVKKEDELVYEMVLALLEHQLSLPIQWIATQDTLLGMKEERQRFIEIGPSATLATMMKKTLTQVGDATQRTFECLTFNDELEAVRKALEPELEGKDEGEGEGSIEASPAEAAPVATAPVAVPVAAPIEQAEVTVEVRDSPPTAHEVVLAIVAAGLKMAKESVDVAQSIRFLAKGRSSLQNEIIGNLTAEFGHLPETVETTALSELSQELQPTHSGKLGPFLREWLTKKVSAKLSPSISISKLRGHLQTLHGLGKGHQDTLLITSADFDAIPARLVNEQESWNTVDTWAGAYMAARGLQREMQAQQLRDGAIADVPAQKTTTRSPELAKFAQDLSALMAKHFSSSQDLEGAPRAAAPADDGDISNHLTDELGAQFVSGTKPYFRSELVYRYQSGWNWAVQDLYVTLSTVIAQADVLSEQELQAWIESQCERLRYRRTARMVRCADFLLNKWEKESHTPTSQACVTLLRNVVNDNLRLSIPRAKQYMRPTRKTIPRTTISDRGDMTYEEVPVRANKECPEVMSPPGPFSPWDSSGFSPRSPGASSAWDSCGYSSHSSTCGDDERAKDRPPGGGLWHVSISTKVGDTWQASGSLTRALHEAERRLGAHDSLPVEGTTLIIGAGQRSIGFMLARQLLRAGCRVAITTGRLTPENRKVVSQMYAEAARPGAELVLLPFNQGSVQDVHGLVEHIHTALGWEIDHLVPFAAVSAHGKNLEDVDSVSELALRVMLTNTVRLMGSIVASKRRRGVLHHATQVLLPLSPNHGQLGNDGLYAESKLALEALLNKVVSEPWGDSLAICGVRMGWSRGTGLMGANDLLAESIEALGARTFSAEEMATLLALVMTPDLAEACALEPILCDFSGGLGAIANINQHTAATRTAIQDRVAIAKRLRQEADNDAALVRATPSGNQRETLTPLETRAHLSSPMPVLPERFADVVPANAADFKDLFDLDSMVVVTGFGELGAAGSARTRWELESEGRFSLEGCLELAWMMGFVRYEQRRQYQGMDLGPGWVESDSGAPIRDTDVKAKYEARIGAHTGIRVLEPDCDADTNPDARLSNVLHEVGLQEDMPPFECSVAAAADLRARHGDAVEVLSDDGTTARLRVRSGATIFVPKALNTPYFVGAQIPQGWDAARYGVPQDIAAQTDKPGLFTLVCTVEAFLAAGITDVYELYRYMHVSEVGNCISSGAGGLGALRRIHQGRLLERDITKSILPEAFVGVAAAWVNMLLLSASGPIKSGAGTCATSLESLDTACDLISSGRAKVCLTGGYDIWSRPIYNEFGEMGAIIDNAKDETAGRAPHEMSRPFTSTRNGFVHGEGAGVQVVTSASVALEMGLPIYGVVALTHMAADGLGRSMTAPGRGILAAAKQPAAPFAGGVKGLIDPAARSRRLRNALSDIHLRTQRETEDLVNGAGAHGQEADVMLAIQAAAALEKKAVRRALGQDYWRNNADISPIAGALSVFGLTVDDITFASLHGTATRLNDVNEAATLDKQMRHLGRHAGNPLLTVAQKSVVGHGLGASGAWALNGALQALHTGLVPGNHNADDVDAALEPYEQLLFSNRSMHLRPQDMRAFCITSFGFGQKGAMAIVVHPRYLFAALDEGRYAAYRAKQRRRARLAASQLDRGLHGQGLVKLKEEPPYLGDSDEFIMNSRARRAYV